MVTSALGAVAELPDEFRPLRRVEFERLVTDGVYEGQPVELLGGVLLEMTPQREPHAHAVRYLTRVLVRALGDDYEVGTHTPLGVDDVSLPEPDVAVLPNGPYLDAHPDHALLVVEVAHSSQRLDLGEKARRYAAAGFPEYWVVDVVAGRVHIHTDPAPDGTWGGIAVVDAGVLRPTVLPQVEVELDELLGRRR